jgi:hypothetical protein
MIVRKNGYAFHEAQPNSVNLQVCVGDWYGNAIDSNQPTGLQPHLCPLAELRFAYGEIVRVACVEHSGKCWRKNILGGDTDANDDLVRPDQNGASGSLNRR